MVQTATVLAYGRIRTGGRTLEQKRARAGLDQR
jgi:hypothetical protein